jgi:hypothetical protein
MTTIPLAVFQFPKMPFLKTEGQADLRFKIQVP